MKTPLRIAALLLGSLALTVGLFTSPVSAQADTYPPTITTVSLAAPVGPASFATDQELLDAINSLNADGAAADEVLGTSITTGVADEVLGKSITASGSSSLALTGNEVSVPLAAGSMLIGAGSLLVLAARKRDNS